MTFNLSFTDFNKYMLMVKKVGAWAGVRYLRNQGVTFEMAHFMILGVIPRKAVKS